MRSGQRIEIHAPDEAGPGVELEFNLPLSELIAEISPVPLLIDVPKPQPPPPPPPPPPPVPAPPPTPPPPVDAEALVKALSAAVRDAASTAASTRDPKLIEALQHAVQRLLLRINLLDGGMRDRMKDITTMLKLLTLRLAAFIDASADRVLAGTAAKVDDRPIQMWDDRLIATALTHILLEYP